MSKDCCQSALGTGKGTKAVGALLFQLPFPEAANQNLPRRGNFLE